MHGDRAHVYVNAGIGITGKLQVEVIDVSKGGKGPNGVSQSAFVGFSMEESVLHASGSMWFRCEWKVPFGQLHGRIQLRFLLHGDVKLYAFRLGR